MAKVLVQRFKATLLCFVLGCLVIPVCAALETLGCVASGTVDGAESRHFVSRQDACASLVSTLSYDSGSARCVQGEDGCDFRTF